jgi:large subunit ribosomal protein L29
MSKRSEFIKEIKSLSREDLFKRLIDLSEELLKLQFKKSSGQLQQTHILKNIRRQKAQIRTVLSMNFN